MTKDEIQATWDDCLVRGWRSDIRMMLIIKHFLLTVKPDLLKHIGTGSCDVNNVQESIDYISSLEIKRRCRDRGADGGLVFKDARGCVRAFIAARSPHMSDCLLAGHSADEVLGSIKGFKWSRVQVKAANARSSQRSYAKKKLTANNIMVAARSLGKKHDWNTVK